MYGYTKIDELKDKLNDVVDSQESIKSEIFMEILSVKNRDIKCPNQNVFFINDSNLKLVACNPEYYNVESQAQRIVKQLKEFNNILTIKRKISEYISTNKIEINPTFKIEINELLINKLKELEQKLKKLDDVK